MKIEDFLRKHIEGYLLKDLENMSKIKLKPPEQYGACGYPMLATILSGMELLGGILSLNPFVDKNRAQQGEDHFKNYWDNYFLKSCPSYNINNLDIVFRNLIRHGLAHTFLAKTGIFVTKDQPSAHLQIDTSNRQLVIDSVEFYKDFRKSYLDYVKLLVFGPIPSTTIITMNHMQLRLNEIEKIYSKDSVAFFKQLPTQTFTKTFSSGASISISGTATFTGTTFTP